MPRRETFGGASNWGDVFAQLAREDLARAQSATRNSVAQAQEDQNAEDNDVFSQWKNGEITDEAWLAYIGTRISDTAGDPEENQKWKDALREHSAAISDAKVEADFALGKLSVGQLMNHYTQRMAAVEKNSPAWRELASRYAQLSDFAAASSRGGGGGGGGGGGEDGRDYNLSDLPAGSVGNLDGPVDPTNLFMDTTTVGDHLDGLIGDLRRIDDIMAQYKERGPNALVEDTLTGETFTMTPDMVRAIDFQYLDTERQIAGVKWMIGDRDGAISAQAAEGTYIRTTLREHNTDNMKPVIEAFEQNAIDTLHAASTTGNTADMDAAYAAIREGAQAIMDGIVIGAGGVGLRDYVSNPGRITKGVENVGSGEDDGVAGGLQRGGGTDLPPELRSFERVFNRLRGWEGIGRMGTDYTLDQNAVSALAGNIHEWLGGEGGMSETDIDGLIQGEINPADQNGGLIGAETHRYHVQGLNAEHSQNGLYTGADPGFAGPRFVNVLTDDGRIVIVPGELREDPKSGTLTTVPADSAAGSVMVAVNQGGRVVTAYATPKPIEERGNTAIIATSAMTINGINIAVGDYVPSSVLKSKGKGWITSGLANGSLEEQQRLLGFTMPGGAVWYWDEATNTVFKRDPVAGAPHLVTETDDFGYALIDDSKTPTGAHLSGARGYPVAFEEYYEDSSGVGHGITDAQMESWVTARIKDGTIDPNAYYEYAADGQVGGSLGPDWITGIYHNGGSDTYNLPQHGRGAKGQTMGQKRDAAIARRNESERQARVGKWIKEEVIPFHGEWRLSGYGGQTKDVGESVAQFGESLGIYMPGNPGGGGQQDTGTGGRSGRGRGPDLSNPVVARDNALESSMARARLLEARANEPRLKPLPAYKAPLRYDAPTPPVKPPKKTVKPPPPKPKPKTLPTYTKQREG